MDEARSSRFFLIAGYTALVAHVIALAGMAWLAVFMLVEASGPEPGADTIMMGYFVPVLGLGYAAFACAMGSAAYTSSSRRLSNSFFVVAAVAVFALAVSFVAAPIVLSA